jgi:hypothetical protein
MITAFLACAALGGIVLLGQLVLSVLGVGDGEHGDAAEHDHGALAHGAEGLNLFSVRALAAGVAFFGFGGLAGYALRGGPFVAIPLAVLLGISAMVGVAWVTRAMLRLDDDGTVRIEGAVGVSGSVYLTIPAARTGLGKVHVTVQNRTVELQAVTTHDAPLPTGSRVLVVDVSGPDTVDVVPDPLVLPSEVSDVTR